jgi:hypothetical protein
MKTFVPEVKNGQTVAQVVDAMYATGDFAPYGREDIFAAVEIFLREYVGLPGTLVTKKFTQDDARAMAVRLNMPFETIVKIIAVFRLAVGKGSSTKQKFIKAYNKVRMVGGGRQSGVTSRM